MDRSARGLEDAGELALHRNILRTLLYYDIWEHPLTIDELYAFLPVRIAGRRDFLEFIARHGPGPEVRELEGYYSLRSRPASIVARRQWQESVANTKWKAAAVSARLIKCFPFVRGVFVSGDLSKNVSTPGSDIDFVVITTPGRLWITRTLLMLFKKIALLNSRKFFCLNMFAATDAMTFDERNVYAATEVAHLKPLYNPAMFQRYLRANGWIADFFPNFTPTLLPHPAADVRPSIFQKVLEFAFRFLPADALESFLLERMKRYWERQYPQFNRETRTIIFRSTRGESRAYAGNYQDRVLQSYAMRLRAHGLDDTKDRGNDGDAMAEEEAVLSPLGSASETT